MVSSFTVPISISSPDGARSAEVEALVDTASTLVVVPPSLARTLGLIPVEEREFSLGNEQKIPLAVALAQVTVGGRTTGARVAISPAEGRPILGVTVLELLGLAVDPVHERLVPVDYLFKPVRVAAGTEALA